MSFTFLLRSDDNKTEAANYCRYQSDEAVSQYCDAHYGPDKFGVVNFSKQLARLCFEANNGKPQRRALDLGCAVGRSTFELATRFDQVSGIDFSSRFIEIANRIQENGKFRYTLRAEGELISEHEISLVSLDLAESADKVSFSQGDAQNLDVDFRNYDLILAANLIDRLPDPGKFLTGIHQRLVIGGLLVIASPYDWQEKFTPMKKWLGGFFRNGRPVSSFENLEKKLVNNFEPLGKPQELEFVIHKTARTFHHSLSEISLWQRVK